MNNEEIMKAAAGIEIEMVTLVARLSEPYRSNVELCAKFAKEIKDEMIKRESESNNKETLAVWPAQ